MRGLKTLALMALLITGMNLQARINSQALYEQGIEAFKTGNYGSSELLFRKIVESGEVGEIRDKAWYHLALSIFNQKKYKGAIFEFNRFLLICTMQQICLESRYWIAESHLHLKDYIRAIEEYKRFISQSKDDMLRVSAYDRIGEIYYLQGRYDEAIIEWREAINRSNNLQQNNLRVVRIGEALYLNENHDEALKLLESLIRSKIEKDIDAKARIIIGKIYQFKKRHRDALRIYYGISEQVLKKAPFYDVQYLKALSAIEQGDPYSAKSFLESFMLLGKESEYFYDAKYQLGNIMIKEGKEKEGIAILDEVRSSTRKMGLRSRAALILGNIYLKQNVEKALPYLEDAVSLDDPVEQKNAMLLLSRVYLDVKRYEDAERLLQLLSTTYPDDRDNDQVLFLIAQVYFYKNDTEKALESFEKIKIINPGSQYIRESYYFLGLSYMKKNDGSKALELLEKYISLPGVENRYQAYVYLVKLSMENDDLKNSERYMNVIINSFIWHEGVENIIYEYGMFLKEKKIDIHKKYFNLVVQRFPRSVQAGEILLLWGDEYFEKKDYAQSEKMYQFYLAVKDRENAGSVFLYRIISLYNLNRFREVISAITAGDLPRITDYTRKQLSLWLARSYFRTEKLDLAYKTFMSFPLRDFDPADLIKILHSALKVGDVATAEEIAVMLEDNSDYYPEAQFVIGEHYRKLNQPEIAERYYKRILETNPDSTYADAARLNTVALLIGRKEYNKALEILKQVSGKKHQEGKNALTILALFRSGKADEAARETLENLERIAAIQEGEAVIKENLWYYYRKGDEKQMKLFAAYMGRFPGNTNLVNYLWGRLYFDKGAYNTSYYFFYKAAQADNEFQSESLYHLGLISIVHQKNRKLAILYFTKLAGSNTIDSPFVVRAKLNLSIIYNEMGNGDRAAAYLKEVDGGMSTMTMKIQSDNLKDYFGYSERKTAR